MLTELCSCCIVFAKTAIKNCYHITPRKLKLTVRRSFKGERSVKTALTSCLIIHLFRFQMHTQPKHFRANVKCSRNFFLDFTEKIGHFFDLQCCVLFWSYPKPGIVWYQIYCRWENECAQTRGSRLCVPMWCANTTSSARLQIMQMVTLWIVIVLTVFGSGVLAYLYYKVLNYFIRIKFESQDPFEPEPEPPRSRKFRVYDKDEDEIYYLKDINNMKMKIHRS